MKCFRKWVNAFAVAPSHSSTGAIHDCVERMRRQILKQDGFNTRLICAADGASIELICKLRGFVVRTIGDGDVRASERNRDTPFLMVTAESGSGSITAAGAAGVSAYLLKPYNAETLRAKMDEVYAQKRGA